jgi:hypothetical protein
MPLRRARPAHPPRRHSLWSRCRETPSGSATGCWRPSGTAPARKLNATGHSEAAHCRHHDIFLRGAESRLLLDNHAARIRGAMAARQISRRPRTAYPDRHWVGPRAETQRLPRRHPLVPPGHQPVGRPSSVPDSYRGADVSTVREESRVAVLAARYEEAQEAASRCWLRFTRRRGIPPRD